MIKHRKRELIVSNLDTISISSKPKFNKSKTLDSAMASLQVKKTPYLLIVPVGEDVKEFRAQQMIEASGGVVHSLVERWSISSEKAAIHSDSRNTLMTCGVD